MEDLVLMDVEAAELIMLRPAGDGERVADESLNKCPHHFLSDTWIGRNPKSRRGRKKKMRSRSPLEKELAPSALYRRL